MITYTYKIKTIKSLEKQFIEHLNITRCIYNLSKEVKETAYSKGVKLSKFDLIKQLPELKKEFIWMSNVNAQTLQGTIERLYKGYDKFYRDLKIGVKTSKPKWAKRQNWKCIVFKQSDNILRFEKEGEFNLPKIGKIKIFKSREVYGNIKVARVLRKADGWYLQIVTDYEVQKCENQAELGIDLGIKHFVVTSEGQFFENIRTSEKYEKELRKAQRSLSRKKKFSKNFYKQVEKIKKIHLKIQRVREDYLHKVSQELSKSYQYVFAENLKVDEMVLNSKYSKYISDVSWGKFLAYLKYKTNLVKVDAKYSSQECSNCGYISKENRKKQEIFKCIKCFHSGNADFEASITILKRGQLLLHGNVGQ